jgi:hypothetical protein
MAIVTCAARGWLYADGGDPLRPTLSASGWSARSAGGPSRHGRRSHPAVSFCSHLAMQRAPDEGLYQLYQEATHLKSNRVKNAKCVTRWVFAAIRSRPRLCGPASYPQGGDSATRRVSSASPTASRAPSQPGRRRLCARPRGARRHGGSARGHTARRAPRTRRDGICRLTNWRTTRRGCRVSLGCASARPLRRAARTLEASAAFGPRPLWVACVAQGR